MADLTRWARAAQARWSRTQPEERREATAAGRAAIDKADEDQVDPDRTLDPDTRAALVAALRRDRMTALAERSVESRRGGRPAA